MDKPLVMGILNATPDSFYTRGRDNTVEGHVAKAEKMLQDGATLLDIGGLSTRPGAEVISANAEMDRVLPVIKEIKARFPEAYLSIDTYRSQVARMAVEAGADMVNDISSGDMDTEMLGTVAALRVPYIAMHMQGTPADMQKNPVYSNIAEDVLRYFINKIEQCELAGIKDIILDPGFGFGKTLTHNYQLLKQLEVLQIPGKTILAGLSRKSMIYKLLGTDAEQALNGTTALHMLALQKGAFILRVHDVREAMECIKIFSFYQTI